MGWRDSLGGSHIPVLVKMMKQINGPVLELGIGHSSTPILHWLCAEKGLPLLSLEDDKDWYDEFASFKTFNHRVEFVEDWNELHQFKVYDTRWSIALIDNNPVRKRVRMAKRLRHHVDFLLLHDAEPENDYIYSYSTIYNNFKYKYIYDKVWPFTAILSRTKEIKL